MSILPILLPLLLSADGHDSKPEREVLSVLLVDGQNNHAWPRTSPVLRAILEETGRFTVDVATSPPNGADLSGFQPDFAAYDVVVSNYNGATWPEETRDAFEAYVSGGGGFVCVHAADNAFPEWRAYNEMIAVGGWGRRTEASGPYLRLRDGAWTQDTTAGRGGSHGRQHEFLLEARAEHPILEGLPERWLHTQDELYDRLRGPALNVTVLASAYSRKETGGSGEHEPILMTIDYGEGRVFHTTMGHDVPALRCVGFQATLDRVVVERDASGNAISAEVIDFKSDRVAGGELEESVAYYRPQLAGYRRVVARITGLDEDAVRMSLLFLHPGKRVQVEP